MKSLQGRTSVSIPTKYVFLGVGALAALMFVLTVRMFYISLGGGGTGGGGDALRGNDMSSIGATPSVSFGVLLFRVFTFAWPHTLTQNDRHYAPPIASPLLG